MELDLTMPQHVIDRLGRMPNGIALIEQVKAYQRQARLSPYPICTLRYVRLEKRIGRSLDYVRISRVAQHVYRSAKLYGFTRNPY